ncbi:MAG: YicC/YloC family endoribonuclease [Pseudomonadota bacterium]
MIRSMTAFARQHRQTQGGGLCWELRSVNHRFLEISLRLPDELHALELAVRERIAASLKRGKVECQLRFEPTSAALIDPAGVGLGVNLELVKHLVRAAREVGDLLDDAAPLNALEILRWPGVLKTANRGAEQLATEAMALLEDALGELIEARVREGAKMAAAIEQRCAAMLAIVEQVRLQLPSILAQLRARLTGRFAELNAEIDPTRLEQEMLILIQKMDVDEELERLAMHIQEVGRVLHEREPVGRRLDFLMQELNREANTLGAKSVDQETTRASIELKVLIEQVREQIQNIE